MKNEKFCFSKNVGIVSIVGIVLIGFILFSQTLTKTQTSTNSRAAAISAKSLGGGSPTPIPPAPVGTLVLSQLVADAQNFIKQINTRIQTTAMIATDKQKLVDQQNLVNTEIGTAQSAYARVGLKINIAKGAVTSVLSDIEGKQVTATALVGTTANTVNTTKFAMINADEALAALGTPPTDEQVAQLKATSDAAQIQAAADVRAVATAKAQNDAAIQALNTLAQTPDKTTQAYKDAFTKASTQLITTAKAYGLAQRASNLSTQAATDTLNLYNDAVAAKAAYNAAKTVDDNAKAAYDSARTAYGNAQGALALENSLHASILAISTDLNGLKISDSTVLPAGIQPVGPVDTTEGTFGVDLSYLSQIQGQVNVVNMTMTSANTEYQKLSDLIASANAATVDPRTQSQACTEDSTVFNPASLGCDQCNIMRSTFKQQLTKIATRYTNANDIPSYFVSVDPTTKKKVCMALLAQPFKTGAATNTQGQKFICNDYSCASCQNKVVADSYCAGTKANCAQYVDDFTKLLAAYDAQDYKTVYQLMQKNFAQVNTQSTNPAAATCYIPNATVLGLTSTSIDGVESLHLQDGSFAYEKTGYCAYLPLNSQQATGCTCQSFITNGIRQANILNQKYDYSQMTGSSICTQAIAEIRKMVQP